MASRFRVLFHGLAGEKEGFEQEMGRLGAPPDKVLSMLARAPIILKEGMAEHVARKYAAAVRAAGGRVSVQEYEDTGEEPISIAPFEDFTVWPECGLKQQKGVSCPRCGFRFERQNGSQEKGDVSDH